MFVSLRRAESLHTHPLSCLGLYACRCVRARVPIYVRVYVHMCVRSYLSSGMCAYADADAAMLLYTIYSTVEPASEAGEQVAAPTRASVKLLSRRRPRCLLGEAGRVR